MAYTLNSQSNTVQMGVIRPTGVVADKTSGTVSLVTSGSLPIHPSVNVVNGIVSNPVRGGNVN